MIIIIGLEVEEVSLNILHRKTYLVNELRRSSKGSPWHQRGLILGQEQIASLID